MTGSATPASASLQARLDWVTEVLDALPKTVPHRRAALLAAASETYEVDVPVTKYAPGLFELPDAQLAEVASLATFFAHAYPTARDDPMPERERVQYLQELRGIVLDIEADEGLAPAERHHLRSLAQELIRALEEAPRSGARPVETAAKAVVGDSVVSRRLWERIRLKLWAKKFATVAAGIIMLVGSYSSAKELATDAAMWFGQPLAIVAEGHHMDASPPDARETVERIPGATDNLEGDSDQAPQ